MLACLGTLSYPELYIEDRALDTVIVHPSFVTIGIAHINTSNFDWLVMSSQFPFLSPTTENHTLTISQTVLQNHSLRRSKFHGAHQSQTLGVSVKHSLSVSRSPSLTLRVSVKHSLSVSHSPNTSHMIKWTGKMIEIDRTDAFSRLKLGREGAKK